MNIDKILDAYIETAQRSNRYPLDEDFTRYEMESIKSMWNDIDQFLSLCPDLHMDPEQFGHDLWLRDFLETT